jgi:dTDP-D-glucose 4,6-dehydratase
MNRAADNSLAKRLLGWELGVTFIEGLHQTIDWYFSTKDRGQVQRTLSRVLTERSGEPHLEYKPAFSASRSAGR